MDTLKDFIDNKMEYYFNLSYEELVKQATQDWIDMQPYFNSLTDDGNGVVYTLSFIIGALGADAKASDIEIKFIKEIFNIDEDIIRKLGNKPSPNLLPLLKQIYKQAPQDIKQKISSFCMCFIVVDKEITDSEIKFMYEILL